LPGSQQLGGDGFFEFVVRGTDAHAWPEVFFEDYGWIAFEPTPRQGVATQPTYTIPPQRPDTNTLGGVGPDDVGVPVEAEQDVPGFRLGENPQLGGERDSGGLLPGPLADPAWRRAFVRMVATAVALVLTWIIVVPGLKLLRQVRRYRRAAVPSDVTTAAWAQLEDDAAEMSLARSPAESATAFAHRLGSTRTQMRPPATRLAALYDAAQYSPRGVTEKQAHDARRLAKIMRSGLWAQASVWRKGAWLFSPRSLVPTSTRGRSSRPQPGTA
jgi:hypothetical protein